MDYIRSAYEVDCRFFADQPDNVTRICWYFADPGAKKLPYRHHFGSRAWEQPESRNGDIGELVPGNRRWYDGANFTGNIGVGNSIPEAKWFVGCGGGEGLTGAECEPGFWESLRLGLAAYLRARREVMELEWKYGPGGSVRLVPFPSSVVQYGSHFLLRVLVPPGGESAVVHLGLEVIFLETRVGIRFRQVKPVFGVVPQPGRLGGPIIFRGRFPYGMMPVLKGPRKPFAPMVPCGFAPIIKGPGKVLISVPPPAGFLPLVKGPGKVLVTIPPPVGFASVVGGPGKIFAPLVPVGLAGVGGGGSTLFSTGACACFSAVGAVAPLDQAEISVAGRPWSVAVTADRQELGLVAVVSASPWLCSVGGVRARLASVAVTGQSWSVAAVAQTRKADVAVTGRSWSVAAAAQTRKADVAVTASSPWSCAAVLSQLHVVTCCSNALPYVLHSTQANNAGCSCATGTIALIWNAATSRWEGHGAFGSCPSATIYLRFYCLGGGGAPSSFRMDYSFDNTTFTTVSPNGTPVCSTLSVVFLSLAVAANCNGPGMARTFKMTVAP